MNRVTNYVFAGIIIYLFILEGRAQDHIQILSGFALSILLAYTTFLGNWITLDAARSVIILGTIILGFGGWILSFAVIFFFISSSLLTRKKRLQGIADKKDEELLASHDLQKRRDGYQVWANGFWIAIFVILWFLLNSQAFLIAAFAVAATATADTWATELGSLHAGKTWLITSMEPVTPGTDGGVSFRGTIAALLGSAAIASFLIFFSYPLGVGVIVIVFLAGFLGCIADSVLGALFRNRYILFSAPHDFTQTTDTFKNSLVNWISTGLGGLLALLFTQLLLL